MLVAHRGQWKQVEFLGRYSRMVVATSPEENTRGTQPQPLARCAVSNEVIQKGLKDPAAFTPLVRLYPNSQQQIPDNVQLLSDTPRLVPGTPSRHGSRNEVTFIEVTPEGKVLARNDNSPQSKIEALPGEFGIQNDVWETLGRPGAREKFAVRIKALTELLDRDAAAKEAALAASISRRQFNPPESSSPESRLDVVPKGFVEVLPDTSIPRGTPLIGRELNRWRAGTAVFEPAAGRVEVRWHGNIGSDERPSRSFVFIASDLQDELRSSGKRSRPEKVSLELTSGVSSSSVVLSNLLKNELQLDSVMATRFAKTTEPVILKENMPVTEARVLQARIAAAGGVTRLIQDNGPVR